MRSLDLRDDGTDRDGGLSNSRGRLVALTNIAGARFVSLGDARIVDLDRLAGVAPGRSSPHTGATDDEPVSTTSSDHARSR